MIKDPIPWPNGARCAVAFTFDMDADSILHLAHHSSADTRVMGLSVLRYGPEIAIPRIVETYKQFDMTQTFFLPAWCMERYPEAVEAVMKGGHEIGHHGYLQEAPNSMARDEEREWLQRRIAVIERFTGARPKGYRAPAYRFSRHTLDLLVEAGFDYDASLMGDDIPYLLDNGTGTVVELPSHYALDDWPHFMTSRDFGYMVSMKTPAHAVELYQAEFDAAWEFGGLWIAVWHPFLSGRLARWAAMVKLIEYMHGKGGVWFATLEEISAHVRHVVDDGSWRPRTDRLPYYDKPIPELGKVAPALATL
ncbi:MAG: polysaccharide deacetylase [Alphaproteobacteria bacterium]